VGGRRKFVRGSPGRGFGGATGGCVRSWSARSWLGRKPRRVAVVFPSQWMGFAPTRLTNTCRFTATGGAAKREAADGSRFQNGAGAVLVNPNSHRSTPRILEPPTPRGSPKVAADEAVPVRPLEESDGVASVANARISESEAAAWTATLHLRIEVCVIFANPTHLSLHQ